MSQEERLMNYLEGNINDTEFISQWLLENANADCTDTAELALHKENVALRSLAHLLLLEIKYPIAKPLYDIKVLREELKHENKLNK